MKKQFRYLFAFSIAGAVSVTAIMALSAGASNKNLNGGSSSYSITVNDGNCYGLPQSCPFNDGYAWTDAAYAVNGDAASRSITFHA